MALLKRRPLAELEERIGVQVRDKERLERALTHSSLRPGQSGARSYERLEFMGDRVLGLVIAERLFEMFPRDDEGGLSLRLNTLVSANACAEIADELGLHEFLRHGGDLKRVKGKHTKNIRADLVEALIAAIYLSEGLETTRAFILRVWGDRLVQAGEARQDAKTALQEWAHTRGTQTPRYETVGREGPDHDPVFTVRVSVPDVEPGEGRGRSKRLAEQEAAKAVLLREEIWKDEA